MQWILGVLDRATTFAVAVILTLAILTLVDELIDFGDDAEEKECVSD